MPLRYLILEKSPSLRMIQQKKLQAFQNIEWHEEITMAGLEGVILANEFFDALPVERFVRHDTGNVQTDVDYQNETFVETGEGERCEKCLLYPEVLSPILKAFVKGGALIIDYGAEQLDHSTLTAYQNHEIVSVFKDPGLCDLTAHVHFTDLAQVFIDCGWQIDFLKTQAHFLLEQGILPETGLNAENYGLKRLLDPRLMGERFKVMKAEPRLED